MVHQLGRTELENLAPLRGYLFGRTGLSFGRKKLLAPPKKCPKNAYVHAGRPLALLRWTQPGRAPARQAHGPARPLPRGAGPAVPIRGKQTHFMRS